MSKGAWKEHASCLNLDRNIFFEKYEENEPLRRAVDDLCKACPVRQACLGDGVSRQEWGVWGGVYLEKGKISKEFNSHKSSMDWFNVWTAMTMEKS